MNAFLETLAPMDLIFLVSALAGALGVLISALWQAVAGGFGLKGKEGPSGQESRKLFFKVFLAGDGFLMIFGIVGLALQRVAEAEPQWAVVGAVGAGALVVALILGLDPGK